jgi:hypothetical protein
MTQEQQTGVKIERDCSGRITMIRDQYGRIRLMRNKSGICDIQYAYYVGTSTLVRLVAITDSDCKIELEDGGYILSERGCSTRTRIPVGNVGINQETGEVFWTEGGIICSTERGGI